MHRALPPLALGAVVVAAWQLGAFHALFGLEAYTLAYPADILTSMGSEAGSLAGHVRYTLLEAAVGFAIGSALGLGMALVLSEIPFARRGVLPIVSGLASMPVIALAPLMALYFGLGFASKVAVIVIMTVPPMTVTTFKGLTSVDRELENLLVSYAADRTDVLLRLRLPWAMPFIFTGLKLNVTLSLIGAIIAEFFAAQAGLGFRMSYALDTFDMRIAWGTMVLAAVLGVVWYQLVTFLERIAVPWHVSLREQVD